VISATGSRFISFKRKIICKNIYTARDESKKKIKRKTEKKEE